MKPAPLLTLLTDFGTRDAYVAAMKGVILGIAPQARIVDITHDVAPQDVAEAAFTLAACWRCFPEGTVHVVVVDPGVGSARRAIAVAAGGHLFAAPDNGVLSMALAGAADIEVVALENPRLFRQEISSTFHGRDIFAPAAAHLASGFPLEQAGPALAEIVRLPDSEPRSAGLDAWEGAVIAVDRFGNLITNVPASLLAGRQARVSLCGEEILEVVQYYAQAPAGALVALIGSSGFLEVAVNQGSAAGRLGAGRGTAVRVTLRRR